MTFTELTVSDDHLALSWLIRLRWAATLAQLALVIALVYWLVPGLPEAPLFAIVGAGFASNAIAHKFALRNELLAGVWLKSLLTLDIAALTALLYFSGGSSNPFSTLYLTQVTVAAVLLRTRLAYAFGFFACLCYGLLFYYFVPIGMDHHAHDPSHSGYDLHLKGMWISFLLVAASTIFFVTRVRNDLTRKESEVARLKHLESHQQRLAALLTLSAGAAHELSTPLATIGLIVSEVSTQLKGIPENDETHEDLLVARQQVNRCKQILQSMSGHFNEISNDDTSSVTPDGFASKLRELFPSNVSLVREHRSSAHEEIFFNETGLLRSIETLVDNALQAPGRTRPVEVVLTFESSKVRVSVRNDGNPILPETLGRLGEPFFTTKEPGQGMGLGLFLVRLFCQRHSGSFNMMSNQDQGTVAEIILPVQSARHERAA